MLAGSVPAHADTESGDRALLCDLRALRPQPGLSWVSTMCAQAGY